MAVVKFQIGKADSSSTPSSPVIDSGDYYVFTINPRTWEGSWDGGVMLHTISGKPRVSTTQLPDEVITLDWQKVTATEKKDECDYYFLLNEKLVLIDDQSVAREVVVVPGSYRASRRRSVYGELESYTVQVQLRILHT